jgi:hypothetical protein
MGMIAGLYLVPGEEFGPGCRRPRFPADGPWFDIDKAWWEFEQVFRGMPPSLDLAIAGDIPPEERAPEDIDATSLSFVSPGAAAEIARVLEQIEPGEMVRLIGESAGPLDDGDRELFADSYEELRRAYRAAAAAGAGLAVLLC